MNPFKKPVVVIPSRLGSTRLPEKALVRIAGQPMIGRVCALARSNSLGIPVVLATDDQRIAQIGRDQGVHVVMTPSDLPSGSDRVWSAIRDSDHDVIINVQGDEPLLNPEVISLLFRKLGQSRADLQTLARPSVEADLVNPSKAKIVTDKGLNALYFSRLPIPYSRIPFSESFLAHRNSAPVDVESASISSVGKKGASFNPLVPTHLGLTHIGTYAYQREALRRFCEAGPCPLELHEGLEQLRALYLGLRIHVTLTNEESHGVDTAEDIAVVEATLRAREK